MRNHLLVWNKTILEDINLTDESILHLVEMLREYHEKFSDCCNHINQNKYSFVYLLGILSGLDDKTMEAIALRFLGKNGVRNLQKFMKDSPWDDKKAMAILQTQMHSHIYTEDSMLTIDSSECLKKGKDSPGASRQFIGSVGKNDNGQSGVFIGFTGSKGYSLIHHRLYMPEKWFKDDYKKRRARCLIPKDLEFKTKLQLAVELLKEVERRGFKTQWLGFDSFFGSNHEFIDAIKDDYYYLGSVHCNAKVWIEAPEVSIPPYKEWDVVPHK